MKKITGYVSVRALGTYDFEFFVEDETTDEEIKQKVKDTMQLSYDYWVEPGYKKRVVEEYYKEDSN